MNENEESWEHEYPEGSLGWKINRKIAAIEAKPLKSGVVFMLLFVAFFAPALVEILLYPRGPFFVWRLGLEEFNLAAWHLDCYIVALLMFAGAFFYFGAGLVWHGWKTRNKK